jgi:hypothetical protein
VLQPGIGAKRRQEGLLKAVLGIRVADAGHQEPMKLGRMVVDQALEGG